MSSESEQLRRSWITNAANWCDAVRNRRIESRRLVTDAAIVTAVLELNPRRVLDVGCGEGWLARALADHGVAVTGVDASVPLIEAAKSLGRGEFFALSYEELMADPTLPGSPFDAVVANFSILDDRADQLLAGLKAAMAVDGHLIVQTVHPLFARDAGDYADGWRTETFDGMPGKWPEPMPWYFRTLASWSRILAGAGYAIAEIREPMYADRPVPASILFICTC